MNKSNIGIKILNGVWYIIKGIFTILFKILDGLFKLFLDQVSTDTKRIESKINNYTIKYNNKNDDELKSAWQNTNLSDTERAVAKKIYNDRH